MKMGWQEKLMQIESGCTKTLEICPTDHRQCVRVSFVISGGRNQAGSALGFSVEDACEQICQKLGIRLAAKHGASK